MLRRIIIILICLSSYIAWPLVSQEQFLATTLYVVRHGQTDWNIQERIQGQSDFPIPLNETGRAEAVKLASQIQDIAFSTCFSSDLQRAYETALILITERSIPIITDKRLRERTLGHWEGHYFSEFYAAGPEEKTDVESNESMQQRALESLEEIANQYKGDSVLIVTHGGIMRNLIFRILKPDCAIDDIETKNTAILKLTYSNGQWVINDWQGVRLPLAH